MKATLEYSLPEEDKEHKRAIMSFGLTSVLWNFMYNSHKELERDTEGMDNHDTLHIVYKYIQSELDRHGIVIDNLIE